MTRGLRHLLLGAAATALLLASGLGWYTFSTPPDEPLPLPDDLVAAASATGRELLAAAPSRVDYGQLLPFVKPQSRRGFCGPATSAAVINAALRPPVQVTQTSLFDAAVGAVKGELAVSLSGMTLDELAQVLRARGLAVRVVRPDQTDLASFRHAAQATLSEPSTFLVVNYDRRALRQAGAGHISPVGAFDPATDRLLVMDVAAHRYPYTWVPVTRLWRAMDTTDPDSGRSRGYLLVAAAGR